MRAKTKWRRSEAIERLMALVRPCVCMQSADQHMCGLQIADPWQGPAVRFCVCAFRLEISTCESGAVERRC
jgi:hypothetical protein